MHKDVRHKLLAAAMAFAAILVAQPASAQQQPSEVYCTTITELDKVNSRGDVITDAAGMIQQDRANYHEFGYRDAGDEPDGTFFDARARAEMSSMLDNGHFPPEVIEAVLTDTPELCIKVFGLEWLEVYFAEDYRVEVSEAEAFEGNNEDLPFIGTWDCEVAVFTFTDSVYNNGTEDEPIREIQEGTDGSYTLLFDDDSFITLSGFTGDAMGWYSGASQDNFNCRRID